MEKTKVLHTSSEGLRTVSPGTLGNLLGELLEYVTDDPLWMSD